MNKHYDHLLDLTLTTEIASEQDGYYVFKDTVFYGEKGGQPADTGTINGLPVVDLKWEGNTLYHKVDGELTNPIEMQVDQKNRVVNTAIQSTFHLLDGFFKDTALTMSEVHGNPDHTWFELDSEDVSDDLLQEVNDYMQQVILADAPVNFTYMNGADYPDPDYQQFDELRIVEIGDYDKQPCGTPHVDYTGQIGAFAILGRERGHKETTRVRIAVNQGATDLLTMQSHILEEMQQDLSATLETLPDKVAEMKATMKIQKDDLKAMTQAKLAYEADDLLAQEAQVIDVEPEGKGKLRQLANILRGKATTERAFVMPADEGFEFTLVSPAGHARDYMQALQAKEDSVKGGGSPQVVTGRVALAARSEVKDLLQAVLVQ